MLLSYLFLKSDSDWRLKFKSAPPPDAFKNQVVWITGASQGLGEAMALFFAKQGARLVLSSRRLAELERVRNLCLRANSACEVEVLPLDVTGPFEDLQSAANRADALFSGAGVDYLIHNAGASQHALVEDTQPAVDLAMLQLNVVGPINLTHASLGHMLRRKKGHIVVVCSMAAKVPSPGQSTYAACKHAVFGYFGSLKTEVCDRGISVTLVCPGPIATGTDDHPRQVFGPGGMQQKAKQTGLSKSRVPPPRVVELIARAVFHRLDEVWIARNPVLALGHVMQFLPWLGWRVMCAVGPSRARDIKGGGSGYDVKALMFGAGGAKKAT